MSQEKQNNWSSFTTEKLKWRRKDLQKGVDANPDEEQQLAQFVCEIDAELERRQKSTPNQIT